MKNKLKVGILGATGLVGQRFITLLDNHPWFEIVVVAASPKSAGLPYQKAVKGRWKMKSPIPKSIKNLIVLSVEDDIKVLVPEINFVFCALNMRKEEIRRIEEGYAELGIPVISNNSAHRWTEDIPMIMPEVNPEHIKLINVQMKNRGWRKGFIALKPNCSIQSYVSILTALKEFKPKKVHVVSLQAISGAGKNFEEWPEMIDNVIPFIRDEEAKSENEPLKIWGELKNNRLHLAKEPEISATCIRIPVTHGHMASVSVSFKETPSKEQIIDAIENFNNPIAGLNLPSAPSKFIRYFEEENRPQIALDKNFENGMGISMGRIKKDILFDWKFVTMSHNTIRGAAGGAILMAELLVKKGYIS